MHRAQRRPGVGSSAAWADGVNLVMVARRAEKLAEVAAALQARHDIQTEIITADLADQSQRDAVEARLGTEQDAIDLLVNCAGGGLAGTLITRSVQQRNYEVELNCVSVLRLSHVAATAMTGRGHGRSSTSHPDRAITRSLGPPPSVPAKRSCSTSVPPSATSCVGPV